MKRKILLMCVILWITAGVFMIKSGGKTEEVDIVTAFENEKYMEIYSSIIATAYSTKEINSDEEKKEIINTIYKKTDMDNAQISWLNEDGKEYIFLKAEFENPDKSMFYYSNVVKNTFEDMRFITDVYSYMKGSIYGSISYTEREEIISKILKGAEAKECERYEEDNRLVIYGYSENISGYISAGGEKINVNIVVRYDENSGITEVYLATPILNEDF